MANFKVAVLALAAVLSFSNCKKKSSTQPTNGVPTVNTISPSDVGTSKAKVSGEVTADGGSEVALRGICWSINPNPTIESSQSVSGAGLGGYTAALSGLKSNTKYYVRAFAINSTGVGYGSEITFTTASASFSASVAGSAYSPTLLTVNTISGILGVAAIKGNQQITLFLSSTVTVGTFPLQAFGTYDAQYSPNISSFKILTVKSGSITISEVNTANGKVKGTFNFVAEESGVTATVSITNGAFEVYK
jgi:Family of unknown function (DUF6252)